MRRTFRKTRRRGKHGFMVSGGEGKDGPWVYAGYQRNRKKSAGVSFGTRGPEIHGRNKGKKYDVKGRYNINSKMPSGRIRRVKRQRRKRRITRSRR